LDAKARIEQPVEIRSISPVVSARIAAAFAFASFHGIAM